MKPGRVSVFREVSLVDEDCHLPSVGHTNDPLTVKNPRREQNGPIDGSTNSQRHNDQPENMVSQANVAAAGGSIGSNQRGRLRRLLARTIFIVGLSICLANVYPGSELRGHIIPGAAGSAFSNMIPGRTIQKRDNSPTDVCKRWSQQSAIINGTLYLYGGRATSSPDQTSNEWSMLLSKSLETKY
jgi:hypothetical protein